MHNLYCSENRKTINKTLQSVSKNYFELKLLPGVYKLTDHSTAIQVVLED